MSTSNHPALTFPVFSTVHTAQQANGLRFTDYQRYRQWTTRFLAQTRKTLHLQYNTPAGGGKQASTGVGHGPVIDEQLITSQTDPLRAVSILELVLFNAERAWAYASQLRDELTPETEIRKHHLRHRLRIASKHAQLLLSLVLNSKSSHWTIDNLSQAEVYGYALWLTGLYLVEIQYFYLALPYLTSARNVMTTLKGMSSRQVAEVIDERLQQINNFIRVAEYNSKDGMLEEEQVHAKQFTVDKVAVETLLQSVVDSASKNKVTDGITFGNQQLIVSNAKVKDLIDEADRKEAQKKSLNLSDNTFADDAIAAANELREASKLYSEAVTLVRADVKREKKENVKQTGAHLLIYLKQRKTLCSLKARAIKLAAAHRSYQQALTITVANAQTAAPTQQKAKHLNPLRMIRMLDKHCLLGSDFVAAAIAAGDQATIGFGNAVNEAFRSYRCYYAAEAYRLSQKADEAASLSTYAATLTDNALALLTNSLVSAHPSLSLLKHQLEALPADLQMQRLSLQLAYTTSAPESKRRRVPSLVERLGEWNAGNAAQQYNIADVPPLLQPMPVKPVLFDLAFNGIEFDQFPEMSSLSEPATASEPSGTQATSSSGKSLLGRWLK